MDPHLYYRPEEVGVSDVIEPQPQQLRPAGFDQIREGFVSLFGWARTYPITALITGAGVFFLTRR